MCCSYNQSAEFIGEELSLNPLKLDQVSEEQEAFKDQGKGAGAGADFETSPVTETLWLSPTTEYCSDDYFYSDSEQEQGKHLLFFSTFEFLNELLHIFSIFYDYDFMKMAHIFSSSKPLCPQLISKMGALF